MNSYRCPRCGQPVPSWQPLHIRCLIFRLRYLIFGVSVLILLTLAITQILRHRAVEGSSEDTGSEKDIVTLIGKSDNLSMTNQQPTAVRSLAIAFPTKTPTVKLTNKPTSIPTKRTTLPLITVTNIPSKTPSVTISGCLGAPPQRVSVDQRAWVCTKSDRLIVRSWPDRSGTEIARLNPGTYFIIIDGPVCANSWSWWGIQTYTGTKGWVAEGGDEIDPYFICAQNQ
jgi:hypothetical protein